MFVFISALSAGRHAAALWSLYWMSTSALKSNITQLCTFLVTFISLSFSLCVCVCVCVCVCKEEIPYIKKPA